MKIIVPMAGAGKRLRPHTLTTAKPLLPVAGKPIVQRLVEDIVAISQQPVDEIAYVVGHFGEEVEKNLVAVAESLGAKGTIHYQEQPLGTAHAILCAASALEGPVTVAFADTLFRADFKLDTDKDGVLWVQRIADPRAFGVVIVNGEGVITEFKEKPVEFVSDLAMIGIYYFRDGSRLREELQYLMDNKITNGGEYQLPDALRNMVRKGAQFAPGAVDDWMDCGNAKAVVETNRKILGYLDRSTLVSKDVVLSNSKLIEPCYIGPGVVIEDSTVGPFVSLGEGCHVVKSQLTDSVINHHTQLKHSTIKESMIGPYADIYGFEGSMSLGDYSTISQNT